MLSIASIAVVAAIVLALGFFLFRAALPKPLPGIPYKTESIQSVSGDLPKMLKCGKEHGDMFQYFIQQMHDLGSPVIQAFPRPLGKPWVFVADFYETRDVVTRRTKEFDRSRYFGDLFAAALPHNQVSMPTDDRWRAHRKLMNDTMSTPFLNGVVAPELGHTFGVLIKLWKEKSRLAQGRPFSVHTDIHKAALEAIWTATFGSESGSTTAQLELLASLNTVDLPLGVDSPVTFPVHHDPPAFTAILDLSDSLEIPVNSPVPRLHHWLALCLSPRLAAAVKQKNQLVTGQLRKAWSTFCDSSQSEEERSSKVKTALDLIVQKEAQMADREGRKANYDTLDIQDELFGFLFGGHETSATALKWAMKYLTANRLAQQAVRAELKSQLQHKVAAGQSPSAGEISEAHLPHLEATVFETLRLGTVATSTIRVAKVDTEILGYHIPKGTDVFFMTNGPGYKAPALPIDESKRSRGSIEQKTKTPAWENSGIEKFDPSRWLSTDAGGSVTFNPHAGPALPFGAGARGCFGKLRSFQRLHSILNFGVC